MQAAQPLAVRRPAWPYATWEEGAHDSVHTRNYDWPDEVYEDGEEEYMDDDGDDDFSMQVPLAFPHRSLLSSVCNLQVHLPSLMTGQGAGCEIIFCQNFL